MANRDSAGRRAWRWYVQSNVGELRSIKNSRCRAGDRNGTGQVATQSPYPFPDRHRNRVFIAEKPILLHFSNGLARPMPLAGLYSSLNRRRNFSIRLVSYFRASFFHIATPATTESSVFTLRYILISESILRTNIFSPSLSRANMAASAVLF